MYKYIKLWLFQNKKKYINKNIMLPRYTSVHTTPPPKKKKIDNSR